MKKWFNYQLQNISDLSSWKETYQPIVTLSSGLTSEFENIKSWYYQNLNDPSVGINIGRPLVGQESYVNHIKEVYEDDVIKQNIHAWCRDPDYLGLIDAPSYDQVVINNYFQNWCEAVCQTLHAKFEGSQINLQVQRPGYISPLHIDSRKKLDLNQEKKFLATQEPDHRRWIFFLDDWKMGQVFQMGEEFLKWTKGEVYGWSVKDVPHALANIGYDDRFVVLIKAEYEPPAD